ncbi:MAG TPA: hypothetical protein VM308_09180, partial [Sphingomicrobium sp.]|nr:hypothetical protein [Sphingomicrobium sp.]
MISGVKPAYRANRKTLLISCATAALATAIVLPQQARAQAFQGTPSTVSGSVTYDRSTPGLESIGINTGKAIIHWSPSDVQGSGTINFLPAGNSAQFHSQLGDYTVLNRIVPVDPTRTILLDGTVLSTVNGTQTTGGNVWFYSPGGFVVGANAYFDVGGLLLSSLYIPDNFTAGNGGFSTTFSAPQSGAGAIKILDGAQIKALQQNSYIALVAPRIEQGGTVKVDGSAAYVAAEQLTMTMNQGLFDVQVDVGSSDANGIVHSGITGGPSSTGAGDNHRIYMVAVPKNDAMTMLLSGGSVGFDEASSVEVVNGEIILSAGFGIDNNVFGTDAFVNDHLGGAGVTNTAAIQIEGGEFTSSVKAQASSWIEASGGGGTLDFAHNVSLQGFGSATLVARDGETIRVGGDATVSADDLRYFTVANESVWLPLDAQGGIAAILAEGGSIDIAGNARVSADAFGAEDAIRGTAGEASGGWAQLGASSGQVTVGGAGTVSASAQGRNWGASTAGSDSFGGYASVLAEFNGTVTIGGSLNVLASAQGTADSGYGGSGGNAFGGHVEIRADLEGKVSVGGPATLNASATGAAASPGGDGDGGYGSGGSAYIWALYGGSVDFAGNADLLANGTGGTSDYFGGAGDGGSVHMLFDGGTVSVGGDLALVADGIGGAGGYGGQGYGGYSSISFDAGEGASGGGTIDVAGSTRLRAVGTGGGGLTDEYGSGGLGGEGYGGSASIYLTSYLQDEASISAAFRNLTLNANGNGGAGAAGIHGGRGAEGFGGDVSLEIWAGSLSAADITLTAHGSGGAGGAAWDGDFGSGGAGFGGYTDTVVAGTLSADSYIALARGFGGNGGPGVEDGAGGDGYGGSNYFSVTPGGQADVTNVLALSNGSFGGNGRRGGNAYGGSSNVNVQGSLNVGGTVQSSSNA